MKTRACVLRASQRVRKFRFSLGCQERVLYRSEADERALALEKVRKDTVRYLCRIGMCTPRSEGVTKRGFEFARPGRC